AELPDVPISVANLLPFLHAVQESIVESAVARVEEERKTISCRAGCGACCRQLVPVSVAEAAYLADLVAALPADERAMVEERFERRLRALAERGLLERLRTLNADKDASELHELGMEYFAAGVPCPFLVNESCSIHPHRPLVCRQYLVTSPAERCAAPEA